MHLSERVTSLKASATIAVANRARELIRQGVRVISFAAGEPDFDTPEPIKRAAVDALQAGHTKYAPTAGDPETRTVIAEKLAKENRLPGVTPDHVVITTGGKHALYLVFQALLDPAAKDGTGGAAGYGAVAGGEVLLPVPAWVSYDPIARLAGGVVKELPTTPANDFKVIPEQLERAITPRSRILVLNSPSNPCGTMYSEKEIRALAHIVDRAARSVAPEIVVVTDEIYEKIVYGGIEHFSIGSIPELADRTVTINGLSKAYSMTGWRVGYLGGSGEFGKQVATAVTKLQGQTTTNITSFVYPAIRVALTQCAGDVESMRRAFADRAGVVRELLGHVPGLVCPRPTGAFYAFPDVSAYFGRSSRGGRKFACAMDVAAALLDESHVAAVPGEDFGGCGRNHLRFSFACSEDQLREGLGRVAEFFHGAR